MAATRKRGAHAGRGPETQAVRAGEQSAGRAFHLDWPGLEPRSWVVDVGVTVWTIDVRSATRLAAVTRFAAAVVQAAAVGFDLARGLDKVGLLAGDASTAGASLAVFPEAFLPGPALPARAVLKPANSVRSSIASETRAISQSVLLVARFRSANQGRMPRGPRRG